MSKFGKIRVINRESFQQIGNHSRLGSAQVNGNGKAMTYVRETKVSRLVPREAFSHDVRALSPLNLLDGDLEAGDRICDGLEKLSRHLRRLDDDFRSGNHKNLEARARDLVILTDQLGLRQIGQVAADVVYCIEHRDEAALSATVSRLMRLMVQALDHAAGPVTAF